MKFQEKASFSVLKIIGVLIVIVFCSGIAALAGNVKVNTVKIKFSNGSSINVVTSKVKIDDILKENNIVLLSDEKVIPNTNENLTDDLIISITKLGEENKVVIKSEIENIDMKKIIDNYDAIVEKIEVVNVEIPFETITRDVSNNSEQKVNKIIQKGVNGIREVCYKVKYKENVEINREEISSKIIKEPINKIVQINKNTVSTRKLAVRKKQNLAELVVGLTPEIKTMNTSAYTASTCDKLPSDPGYGITSSGAVASSLYTVAAGKGYPIGTIIYIPYFKNESNEGWFVVQDRGGAISNAKLDIYMDTYSECIQFGRRNLQCYIYK